MSAAKSDESRDGVPLTNLDQALFDGADCIKVIVDVGKYLGLWTGATPLA